MVPMIRVQRVKSMIKVRYTLQVIKSAFAALLLRVKVFDLLVEDLFHCKGDDFAAVFVQLLVANEIDLPGPLHDCLGKKVAVIIVIDHVIYGKHALTPLVNSVVDYLLDPVNGFFNFIVNHNILKTISIFKLLFCIP